jgi:hypothetical protein
LLSFANTLQMQVAEADEVLDAKSAGYLLHNSHPQMKLT